MEGSLDSVLKEKKLNDDRNERKGWHIWCGVVEKIKKIVSKNCTSKTFCNCDKQENSKLSKILKPSNLLVAIYLNIPTIGKFFDFNYNIWIILSFSQYWDKIFRKQIKNCTNYMVKT